MARPAYRDGQLTAKERLRKGFWDLLAQGSYGHITVKAVSHAAGVNPNSFYYHYANMEELAKDALDAEKLFEIPSAIRNNLSSSEQLPLGEALAYVAVGDRWKKIRLFVTSDSPVLHRLFYDVFEEFWLSLINVRKEDLSKEDAYDLAFLLHGATSVIALQSEDYDMSYVATFQDRPLGKGAMDTIGHLVEKYRMR